MSEPTNSAEREGLTLPSDPTSAFGQMLEFLAPSEDSQEDPPAGTQESGAGDGTGSQPAAGEGAGAATDPAPAPAAGDGGEPPVAGEGAATANAPAAGSDSDPAGTPAADGTGAPAAGVATEGIDLATITPKLDEMGLKFEERQTEALEREALLDVQQEYPKYFDALRQHPRQLIGAEVPSVTGEGMERLKDSNDARDWQDGVKKLLIDEVASRVDTSREQLSGVYSTVHASIDMFRNNHDLIPGTKGFDRELADAVAQAAQPYELRAKDKLVGYSIPIQPVINAVRQQLANSRGQTAGAAAATTAAQQRAAEQQRAANGQFEAPQAGISSQAGRSSDGDDEASGVLGAFFRQNGMSI